MEMTISNHTFMDKDLQKATDLILSCAAQIKTRQFDIAATLANVDAKGAYKKDGFSSTAEYACETFGFRKTLAYELITIGKEYTRPIMDKTGKRIIGHASNLVPAASPEAQDAPLMDFTANQIGRMLTLGRDKIITLVQDGTLSPQMSIAVINAIVKKNKPPKAIAAPETEHKQEAPEKAQEAPETEHKQEAPEKAQEAPEKAQEAPETEHKQEAPEKAQEAPETEHKQEAPETAQEAPEKAQEAPESEHEPIDAMKVNYPPLNTKRKEILNTISTAELIAEIRARGFKVYCQGNEYVADWKDEENV